ncbi:MAG: MarR family transcriptional regulator [Deltaproteobacteria bacterium]|nr:MarR family transcriptional regulator [Deltaproteobacteria bacterium]MBW2503418.1 MarR family transcriptional regulator [Deltaproteobacteria bacterium]MBW2519215.1 MarR family transcriptional regulator [Deltaproteobacteria bacterium]
MKYHKLPQDQRRALNLYVKMMRATNKLTNRIHRHLKDDNLTVSQFAVLEAIYHLGPLSQGELVHRILKSNANLTTVVDSLEKKSLVLRKRSKDDRRRVTVHLTERGEELIAKVFPRHAKIVAEELCFLDPAVQTELAMILKRFKEGD